MLSALRGGDGGPQKADEKEQNQLISVCDKGRGGQKIGRHLCMPPNTSNVQLNMIYFAEREVW